MNESGTHSQDPMVEMPKLEMEASLKAYLDDIAGLDWMPLLEFLGNRDTIDSATIEIHMAANTTKSESDFSQHLLEGLSGLALASALAAWKKISSHQSDTLMRTLLSNSLTRWLEDIAGAFLKTLKATLASALAGILEPLLKRGTSRSEIVSKITSAFSGNSLLLADIFFWLADLFFTAKTKGEALGAETAGATHKHWRTRGDIKVCGAGATNEAAGAISTSQAFPSGHMHSPAHPYCRCTVIYSMAESRYRWVPAT